MEKLAGTIPGLFYGHKDLLMQPLTGEEPCVCGKAPTSMSNRRKDGISDTKGSLDDASRRTQGVSPETLPDHSYDDRPSWWLRFASYTPTHQGLNRDEEEYVRRSRLTAWVIAGLMAGALAIIPLAGNDPVDLGIVASMYLVSGLAILLNRYGQTSIAGVTMVAIIMLACIAAPILYPGGLRLDEFSDFDAMSLTVVLAAVILPPASAWVAMGANIATILLVFLFVPHAPDLAADMSPPNFSSVQAGAVADLAVPMGMNLFVAVVSFFGVRSLNRSAQRQYAAVDNADKWGKIAVEAMQSSQLQTIEQHFFDKFIAAIDECFLLRNEGKRAMVVVDMPGRPKSAFEAGVRARIAAYVQRINLNLQRRDQEANRGNLSTAAFISALHLYMHTIYSTLRDGESGRLDPTISGKTGFPILDSLAQLVSALLITGETWHLTSRSKVRMTGPYVESLWRGAISAYEQINWAVPSVSAPANTSSDLTTTRVAQGFTPPPSAGYPFGSSSSQPFAQSDVRTPYGGFAASQDLQQPRGYTTVPTAPSGRSDGALGLLWELVRAPSRVSRVKTTKILSEKMMEMPFSCQRVGQIWGNTCVGFWHQENPASRFLNTFLTS